MKGAPMTSDKFKIWLDNATGDEIDALAVAANTSSAYIRHIALGRRDASADMAARIEEGTKKIQREGLASVSRGDLSEACNECPHFKACKSK